jgi:anthraniloyl-CoA monooxygenase
MRPCRFIWVGANLKLPAFTFIFRENEAGLFQVHAYPFDAQTSTFIIECTDEVWRKAGLDRMGEAETLAYFQALFADHLQGAELLTRAGGWRNFPNIHCARWHYKNMVILGDAAHTAHFSIGSGTKLAMEDAIVLADALDGPGDVPTRLAAYDAARRPDVEKLQKVARTSQAWFEHVAWFMGQDPLSFSFNLLTRSRRIGYAELQKRDPALLAQVQSSFAASCGQSAHIPPAFTPFTIGKLQLSNRIVVSPMCQYSAEEGVPNDWHLVHLGSRATGGAGLIIAEATAVSPEGRITPGCTGMYHEDHVAGWKRVTDFVHRHSSAKIGLQIGHAGRKAGYSRPWEGNTPVAEPWKRIAPSALPWDAQSPIPVAMDDAELDRIEAAFVWSAQAAARAGFDVLELHMAHGYLLSTFLSPLTNLRTDTYGGDVQGRLRYPLRILRAVRRVWTGPLFVRLSTTEWAPGGTTDAERRTIGLAMKEAGADLLDCSTGGLVAHQRPDYGRMFQVPFAEQLRYEAGIPVMAVGAISEVDQINSLVAAGRADLCALARKHLYDPAFALHAAAELGVEVAWPVQYRAAAPAHRKG